MLEARGRFNSFVKKQRPQGAKKNVLSEMRVWGVERIFDVRARSIENSPAREAALPSLRTPLPPPLFARRSRRALPSLRMPPPPLLLLQLLLLPLLLRGADAQCAVSGTYSYGGVACSSCATGASFVSAAAGCTPSAALTAGPADTAFYLSGSAAEGVAAFAVRGASWTAATSGNINWVQSAISLDGTKILVASRSEGTDPGRGSIYISSDSGASFTATRPTGATMDWMGAAMSGDGTKMLISEHGSGAYCNPHCAKAYISQDGGANFAPVAGFLPRSITNWLGASSDFTTLAMSCADGNVWTSADSGATWTARLTNLGNMNWNVVAVSANGQFVAAVVYGNSQVSQDGYATGIWLSADAGATWSQKTLPSQISNQGNQLSLSLTGARILACFRGGLTQAGFSPQLFLSSDSGSSWTDVAGAAGAGAASPYINMACISPDGSTMLASVMLSSGSSIASSYLRVSEDGGATWATRNTPGAPNPQVFAFCSMSANGGVMVVSTFPGLLWVSTRALSSVGITHVDDHKGAASGALALASGSYLTVPGASAPAALPSGGSVAWSASAWVKCSAPATWAGVLEWGAAGDVGLLSSPQTAALVVGSAAPQSNVGVVSTLAGGSGNSAFADGVGTAAGFYFLRGVAVIPFSGAIVVADMGNQRIRLVSVPDGAVTTLAGGATATFADGLGTAARFRAPTGIAVFPSSGSIVVTDPFTYRIRIATYPGGEVSTLSGGSFGGFADGPATAARFSSCFGVAVLLSDAAVVVADGNRIRIIAYPSGDVSTLAGSGNPAFADGKGTAASFYSPRGVAVLPASGAIIVADMLNSRIRVVSYPGGAVSTLAGSGVPGSSDGVGTAASFNNPTGVAVFPSGGAIVVADTNVNRIRVVTFPGGAVTTLAGSGSSGSTNYDGVGAAASFNAPFGIAVSPTTGAIIVADSGSRRIRLITIPAVLPACDATWHHIALTYAPSASPYPLAAFLDGALVLALAATVTLPDASSSTLRVGWSGDLSANGGSLFAGAVSDLRIYTRSLTLAEVVALSQPKLPAVASAAQLPPAPSASATSYAWSCLAGFSGGSAALTRSAADGTWAWAGGVSAPSCRACDSSAYCFGSAACASCAAGATFLSASLGCAPSAATSAGPTNTAFYLSGSQAEGVAALTLTGAAPSFVADHAGAASGALALASGAHLDAGGATAPAALPSGGKVAWSASAWVKCAAPESYSAVLEWGGAEFGAATDVQQLAAQQAAPQVAALIVGGAVPAPGSGAVTTLAGNGERGYVDDIGVFASFDTPTALAVFPSSGNVVVSDNNVIRVIAYAGGAVSTLAGNGQAAFLDGVGTGASFSGPGGLAVLSSSGPIFIADTNNHRIRVVTFPDGAVSTLAGSGSNAFRDGSSTTASFNYPSGVAVFPSGSALVVADTSNQRIRIVTLPGGIVSTLVSSGSDAFANGVGAASKLFGPVRVSYLPDNKNKLLIVQYKQPQHVNN
jgi:DNA-binding beta-propeller fold protein YncE